MSRSRRSCGGGSVRDAVTYIAEPLLAGIHAGDVERLSMRALFPRFVEAEAALAQRHPGVQAMPGSAQRGRRVSIVSRAASASSSTA